MSNVLFVVLLENAFVLFSSLQHWQSFLDRHGLHSPEFLIGLMTLLFEILLLPIMSLRFLHGRYAITGRSLNLSSIFGSDWILYQCLLTIAPSGGSVPLYVTTRGILCDLFFIFVLSRLFLCRGKVL